MVLGTGFSLWSGILIHPKNPRKNPRIFSALEKTLEKNLEFFRSKTLETLEKTLEKKV